MGAIHQLLSVMTDLKGRASKILGETARNFKSDHKMFDEIAEVFEPATEGALEDLPIPAAAKRLIGMREGELSSHRAAKETVVSVLEHFAECYTPHLDAELQMDLSNLHAKAKIQINGEEISVPATFLLKFEKMLAEVRKLLDGIPTLDGTIRWEKDTAKGENIWRAPETEVVKTKKITDHRVIVPATDHHPAQVADYVEDVPIGITRTSKWSGKITSDEKYRLLKFVDRTIVMVKKARGQANQIDHATDTVGESFFKALFKSMRE